MKLKYSMGKPLQGQDVLWRCEAQRYSVIVDVEMEQFGISNPELVMLWYPVDKRTKKGAWIWNKRKFVLLTAHKKYACNTEAEAVQSFIARKQRQVVILKGQLARAEQDLRLTQENVFS